MVQDLDMLFPESEGTIEFTGRMDRKRYSLDLFIPAGVAIVLLNEMPSIAECFPTSERPSFRFNPAIVAAVQKVMCAFLNERYPELDVHWLNQNVSLEKQVYIIKELLNPIIAYLKSTGFVTEGKKNMMAGLLG